MDLPRATGVALLLVVVTASGCGDAGGDDARTADASPDSEAMDSRVADSDIPDTRPADVGPPDSAIMDSAAMDSAAMDSTVEDSAGMDSAAVDADAGPLPGFWFVTYAGGWPRNGAFDIAEDSSGNLFVVGAFSATTDFDGTSLVASGDELDAFVASTDGLGALRWVRGFGGTERDHAQAVAVDSAGNVYVTGYVAGGPVDFGGITRTPTGPRAEDVFVASYTNTGTLRWAEVFGGGTDDAGLALAVDASDNIYVGGRFKGSITFGATTLDAGGTIDDGFIVSFDTSGVVRWVVHHDGSGTNVVSDLVVDASGRVVTTGYFSGAMSFGGADLDVGSSRFSGFVARYGAAGAYDTAWPTCGGPGSCEGTAVAVDATSVYITGPYRDTVDLGSGPVTAVGLRDAYVRAFDADGTSRWSWVVGSTSLDEGVALAMDPAGTLTYAIIAGRLVAAGSGVTGAGVLLGGLDPATGSVGWSLNPGTSSVGSGMGMLFAGPGELRVASRASSAGWTAGGVSSAGGGALLGAMRLSP